jgi:hypothetical protein
LSGKAAIWIGKALAGGALVLTPILVIFELAFRVPMEQLYLPYMLLLSTSFITVVVVFIARSFLEPKPASILFSLAIFFLFATSMLIFAHFGVAFRILTPEFSTTWKESSVFLSVLGAISVYFVAYRRLSAKASHRPNAAEASEK